MNVVAERTVPAPRKDLSKVMKRKRVKLQQPPAPQQPPQDASMDIEHLLATLTDNAISEAPAYYTYEMPHEYIPLPPQPAPPQPPPPPPSLPAPRLLLRQTYKVSTRTDAVVGLESTRDYRASMYLVNNQSNINMSPEDLLGLRGLDGVLENYFNEQTQSFSINYLDTILVEPYAGGNIAICNYQLTPKSAYSTPTDVLKQSPQLLLNSGGWKSLKRQFDCIESYYNICDESSPVVQFLITRYSRFFTKIFKTKAMLSGSLDSELVRLINADLPAVLGDMNERQLPWEPNLDHWYECTSLRQALLPWVDSEVRRYCAPNITAAVIENLKYVLNC